MCFISGHHVLVAPVLTFCVYPHIHPDKPDEPSRPMSNYQGTLPLSHLRHEPLGSVTLRCIAFSTKVW